MKYPPLEIILDSSGNYGKTPIEIYLLKPQDLFTYISTIRLVILKA
jgi:hypothetical protein